MNFTERSPIEEGFAQVFEADVAPQLIEFEFERKAVLRKTYRNMGLIAAAAVAVFGVAYQIWDPEDLFIVIAVIIGGAIGISYLIWAHAGSKWASNIKDIAMPVICDHVGELTYASSGGAFSIDTMMDLKLLPKHDKAARSSHFRGTHNGSAFEMVHATLTTESEGNNGRNSSTVFRGLLFRIDMDPPAPGRIVLMRDRGGMGNKMAEAFSFGSTRALPKVAFDDVDFEAAFEVYADRPDQAMAYLSDSMRDAIMHIGADQGRGLGAEAFVAGFQNKSFYMALKRDGAFMKMGGLTTPVTEIEQDLHGVFDDIALIYEVVDRLHAA